MENQTKRINAYNCPNGHQLVTQDIDEGVTPMFMRCRVCGADARSSFYSVVDGLVPTHEWYKPAHPERYENAGMRHHIEQGGLAFREIGGIDETEYMPARPVDQRGGLRDIEPSRADVVDTSQTASRPRIKDQRFSALATRALTNAYKPKGKK